MAKKTIKNPVVIPIVDQIEDNDCSKEYLLELSQQDKDVIWNRLYSKALQLALLKTKKDLQKNRWWFDDLAVNVIPGNESFSTTESHIEFIAEQLTKNNYVRIEEGLNYGLEMYKEEMKEREEIALEKQKLVKLREMALSKLTSEEQQVLGLASNLINKKLWFHE